MKLKISDDAPWKHAANEIVAMLKNVRSENEEGNFMFSPFNHTDSVYQK